MKGASLRAAGTAAAVLLRFGAQASGQTTGATVQERLGHPASARLLVIHADDVGMAHSVNRATFEALEKGWVTCASVMVPCPWFPEVARWSRAHPQADLGVHLVLNSEWTTFRWGPVSGVETVPSLLDADGYLPLLEEAVVKQARVADVERELRAQVDRARAAGLPISHLDSHMATLFRTPDLFGVYRRVADGYGLPLLIERIGPRGGAQSPWTTAEQADALIDRVVSLSAGVAPADWQAAYEKLLAPLPPGAYELIVHLAYDDDEMQGATADHPNWGAAWRQRDLGLVSSTRFRDFLRAQGFVLVDWRTIARARQARPH